MNGRTELETQMIRRIRRHMLTSFGGFLVAIGVLVVGGFVAHSLGPTARWAAVLFPAVAILMIPLIGFYSTFRNVRCPACDRLVAFQASAHYALLGPPASKACNGCGAKIFPDDMRRRFLRLVAIMFAAGVGLAIVGGLLRASSQSH